MPIDVVLNTNARTFLAGLLLARKFTKDEEAQVPEYAELPEAERDNCYLANDLAFVATRPEHRLYPAVALIEGELVLSQKALEAARDAARAAEHPEVVTIASSLLSELSMRRTEANAKVVPPTDPADQPSRIKLAMGDYVSWPSYGTVMHGRIETVHVSGIVRPHKEHPGLVACAASPIATIRVYDQEGNGFVPSQRKIVRPAGLLTRISALQRPKGANVFEIRAKGKAAEILIYSDIGSGMWGGLGAKEFREQLGELKNVDELNVRINSGGGDVFEGVAIYNTLREFKAHKVVHIDGIAASIATVIACAGDVVHMAETAQYMIHRSWTIAMGDTNELAKMIQRLEATDALMANVYAKRTGQAEKDILAMMDEETWFTPDEAKEYGFVDEVTEAKAMAASYDRDWFRKKRPDAEDLDAVDRSQRRFLARGRAHAASR